MKKKMQMLLAALLLLVGAMFASANAQNTAVVMSPPKVGGIPTSCLMSDPYPVVKGDSLWGLNQAEYGMILDCNPFLNASWRHKYEGGKYVVVIKPGEKLYGVKKMQGKLTPILPTPVTAASAPTLSPVKVADMPKDNTSFGFPSWVWLLLLAGAVLWALFQGIKRNKKSEAVNTDPTTAGPPMVPGGLNEVNADNAFQRAAARKVGDPNSYQQFTVLDRTKGRIYGLMTVSYANGTPDQNWNLTGQAAYQARVRFPNGHEETLYMLQACGNDLRYQGVDRYQPGEGFRFVPDPIAEPTPAVVALQASVAPATTETEESVPEGAVMIAFRVGTAGQQDMLRLKGVDTAGFTFTKLADGTISVRYRETPKSASTPSVPAA